MVKKIMLSIITLVLGLCVGSAYSVTQYDYNPSGSPEIFSLPKDPTCTSKSVTTKVGRGSSTTITYSSPVTGESSYSSSEVCFNDGIQDQMKVLAKNYNCTITWNENSPSFTSSNGVTSSNLASEVCKKGMVTGTK